jgi:hypothetical protein
MIIYVNGTEYVACESRWWGKRCCLPAGHDGKHASGNSWYWTGAEAASNA